MKKVGIVSTWFERGASYVSKQYLNILKEHFEVFVYARGGEKYDSTWDDKNIEWEKKHKIRKHLSTYISKKQFKKWIDKNEIDIVFFNEQNWWPPITWCNEWGVCTGSYIDYYTEETIPYFDLFDFLICNTKRHYSVFEKHNNANYIAWGTDTSLFVPVDKAATKELVFFNSLGMAPNRKGFVDLVNAFVKVVGDKKLLLHTQCSLESFYPLLDARFHDELKEGKIEIINKTVTAPGLYHLADVYVYPTKLEGIGLTVPEALSCGLPVIVPNNAPMNEFIKDGTNGFLTNVNKFYCRKDGYYWPLCDIDIDDLANKMQFLVDNKEVISLLKKNARDYAVKNLSWADRESEIVDVFSKASYYKNEDSKLIANILDKGKRKYIIARMEQVKDLLKG